MTEPVPSLEEIFDDLKFAQGSGYGRYGYEMDDVLDTFIVVPDHDEDGSVRDKTRVFVTLVDKVEEQ